MEPKKTENARILPFEKTVGRRVLKFQLEVYENTQTYVVREMFNEDSLVAIGNIRPENILITTACNHYFLKNIGVSEIELQKGLSGAYFDDLHKRKLEEQEKVEVVVKKSKWDLL